jgi:hypothetical protein
MLLYATDLLATWLADAVHGVNALRTTVPRMGADTVPPAVSIVTMYRDADAARVLAPVAAASLPCLQLTGGNQPPMRRTPGAQPYPADLMVEVGIRYRPSPALAPDRALRDAEYTMIALERSITRLFTTAAGEAVRQTQVTTVGQQWVAADATRWEAAYVSDNDTVIAAMCAVTLQGRNVHVQT